jgi:hypothetical protein
MPPPSLSDTPPRSAGVVPDYCWATPLAECSNMSETLQPPLYQTQRGERTPTPEKTAEPNGQFFDGEMSDADAARLLRDHCLPGSDLLPFDSTASPSPAAPGTPAATLPGRLWNRWFRLIATGLGRSRANP